MMNKEKKKKKSRSWNDTGFEKWGGYMPAKKSKLEEQFINSAKKTEAQGGIFKGISIFVNGHTRPTADELKRIMMLQGGMYHQYESAMTTHVIAANLPDTKVKNTNTSRVVRPEWITDSLSAGKLLDYHKYLLCPDVPKDQTRLNFTSKQDGKSKEAEFISEFYNHSRLHHISTMGATFKQYVTELRSKSDGTFPGRQRLKLAKSGGDSGDSTVWAGKVIMHIDMDCFFVSVGLRSRPDLRGFPVAVTHSKGNPVKSRPGVDRQKEFDCYRKRSEEKSGKKEVSWTDGVNDSDSMSEIASCNYEARRAGIKNGMFVGVALKLCPELKTIPYDFDSYKEVSYTLYNTVAEYTLDIEAVSCDEMYADCTDVLKDTATLPLEFSSFLRHEIEAKTQCSASAGFGPNPLVARLATRKAKPNGEYFVSESEVETFLSDIEVENLPGIGHSLSGRLHSMGVKTCRDLRNISLTRLKKEFGNKVGERLFKFCRGRDDRPLSLAHQRKSVSAEVNYGIRFESVPEAEAFLSELCMELEKRLKELNMKGRCLTLKYMVRAKDAPKETAKFMGHGMCDHITKSHNFVSAVCDAATITKEVLRLNNLLGIPPCDLRGIGLQMTRLESGRLKTDGLDRFLRSSSRKTDKISHQLLPIKESDQKLETISKTSDKFVPLLLPSKNESSESSVGVCKSVDSMEPSGDQSIVLDEEVLAALPEDIRQEVLAEYGRNAAGRARNIKQVKNSEDIKDCQKSTITQETTEDGKVHFEKSKSEENQLNEKMPAEDMCRMVREWVDNENEPRRWDVNMLAEYLESLAFSRELDGLYMVARTLHRCTSSKCSLVWNEAYSTIVQRFQAIVSAVYGAPLKL